VKRTKKVWLGKGETVKPKCNWEASSEERDEDEWEEFGHELIMIEK